MILVQDLRDQIVSALDAEGSDHYRDDLDIIPAINASMRFFTTVVNAAYGQNKISEEFFSELTYATVFLTNNNSRVSLSVFPYEPWSILGVLANPETESITGATPPATPDSKRSYHLSNLIHVSSDDDCKRLSVEEWSKNRKNPFEAGYDGDQLCDSLKDYAYLNPINFRASGDVNYMREIEIRPKIVNNKVTVIWAKKPDVITSVTDTIDFPSSMFQLLFDKALNYIAYKQGDQTNLYSVSNADIEQLLTSI